MVNGLVYCESMERDASSFNELDIYRAIIREKKMEEN